MPLPMSLHQSLHLHLAASVFAPFGQDRASLAHVVLGFAVGCRFSQHLSKEAHKALQGLRESRWSFLDTKCGFRQELKEPALDINSPLWLRHDEGFTRTIFPAHPQAAAQCAISGKFPAG